MRHSILASSQQAFRFGAYHTAEIQYLFNIFGTPAPFTADQQQLSDTMIRLLDAVREDG